MMAEAIRWQIREGEVIQAIGRACGANRTAADPVEVLVMTDVVLPFDVEPMEAADLDPRPTELMMAAAGMALANAAHAATCFPDLWPSAEASKKAFQRRRNGTNPEEPSPPRRIPWRHATGPRSGDREASGLHPSPAASSDAGSRRPRSSDAGP
jgi:hypothetical protein